MSSSQPVFNPNQHIEQIIDSAKALGVEMDEEKAIQWLTTMAALDHDGYNLEVDHKSGIYGHRVVLLDFDPADLDRVRRVAAIVELEDRPNVETAIALSGSSAQSHVQTFPGDFDYFERVNIKAKSRQEACNVLGDVIREKVYDSATGPGFQLIEARFGTFTHRVVRSGKVIEPGSSITWSPAEVQDGHFNVLSPDGEPMTIDWNYACQDPGWCKLDWVLVDPAHPRAVKASNMFDATWEDADGTISPLDGFIDPYYQEVYLDAESIPLFSKISQQMDPDALRKYVIRLEKEIRKYSFGDHANYERLPSVFITSFDSLDGSRRRHIFESYSTNPPPCYIRFPLCSMV